MTTEPMTDVEQDDIGSDGERELYLRLRADLKAAAKLMTKHEIRFLVDLYYAIQKDRIRAGNQLRDLEKASEPIQVLSKVFDYAQGLERMIHPALVIWVKDQPLSEWLLGIRGIGPILTAGLIAHIDFEKAQTAGAIWRFAGLDPTSEWGEGEKRPWNASLKVLCWKIAECLVRAKHFPDGRLSYYGKLYDERKAYEQGRNERGELKEQALARAKEKPRHKQIATYKAGKLPAGHIESRVKRWLVKIFLSHLFVKGRESLGLPVPNPFAIEHLGHAHVIPIPGSER